jgi:hypothetical protein
MAEDTGRVQGGCFCGKVRFDVDPEFVAYRYCFCSRCRKMRGTIHAANIFIEPDKFRWLAGEDLVKRFDLEGARFGNCFCSECGSPAPRLVTGGKAYLIPAGAFDSDPGARPDKAIFWDSRAEWLPVAGDTLEKKAEY